jgi:hypothetical protein
VNERRALRARFHRVEHHQTHVAAGFLISPFDEAAVLSVDAVYAVASPPSVWGGGGAATYSVPGGLPFLVPGLLLAAAPRRPYWLILWAVLMALGAVMFGAFVLGTEGVPAGLPVTSFLQNYIVPPLGLGVALLLLARHRQRSHSASPEPTPSPLNQRAAA